MILLLLSSLLILTGCGFFNPSVPLETVSAVNFRQYEGTWYEIARYENRFEKGCVGATAEYRRKADYLQVTNSCFDVNGILIDQARGRAHSVQGSNDAKLRVSFFRPFYGDYWILMLADDYRYSVVGEPGRKYLWILSRDRELSNADKAIILKTLPGLGYDPGRLYWGIFSRPAGG